MTQPMLGYADGKPSESIQPCEDPGIVAAAVIPRTPDGAPVVPPVMQYKGGKQANKAARTKMFNEWLAQQKDEGLLLAGFCTVSTQEEAARHGLSLIEELPDTGVEAHYDAYRLTFRDDRVDFAHAVALQHYWTTLHLAALRAATRMPEGPKRIAIYMDRFPGAETGDVKPGEGLPPTDGVRFLRFVEQESATAQGLREENQGLELEVRFGTLDWWKPIEEDEWRRGKTHPNFSLPDWLAAATMANEFPDEYADSFDDPMLGADAVTELLALHETFTSYDIWTLGRSADHLVGAAQTWTVPHDARQFIYDRALGK